jgi:transcriptional regulator with XRE-family HTH domain
MENLGSRIKKVRLSKNLTQLDIEQRTGIKREYYSKIESGGLSNPTINTLRRLANAMSVSVHELIPLAEDNGKDKTTITTAELSRLKAKAFLDGAKAMRNVVDQAIKTEYEQLKANHEKRLAAVGRG